jgi:hypothetical protein
VNLNAVYLRDAEQEVGGETEGMLTLLWGLDRLYSRCASCRLKNTQHSCSLHWLAHSLHCKARRLSQLTPVIVAEQAGGGVRKGRVTTFDVEIFHNFFVHFDAVAGLPHARQRCLAVATEFGRIEHPLCASLGERA